jgi:hypothetical protein
MSPHIAIIYIDNLPPEPIERFATDLAQNNLKVEKVPRPQPGPYAGLQWLLPTAVAVFFGKSYFDGFLKEAGKDHYNLLKTATHKLTTEYIGPAARKVILFFTQGKVASSEPEYSMVYSLVGELSNGISAKLLLEPELSSDDCARAIAAYLDFLKSFHDGTLHIQSVIGLEEARPVGKTLLVHFNQETLRLEVINPLPKHIGDGQASSDPDDSQTAEPK